MLSMAYKPKLTEQEIISFLDEHLEVEFTFLKSEEPAEVIAPCKKMSPFCKFLFIIPLHTRTFPVH